MSEAFDLNEALQHTRVYEESFKEHLNGNGVAQMQPFHLTDLGNAERFIERYGGIIRWCELWRKWLAFDGRRWQVDESQKVIRFGKHTVRAIYKEAADIEDEAVRKQVAKWGMSSEAEGRIHGMLQLAQSECPIQPDMLDPDPWLLNCANGTLNLQTGQLHPHSRNDLITKIVPIAYDPDAGAPLWEEFLGRIFKGKEDLIGWIQKALGYTLTGVTAEQIFLLCHGVGSNGKSTFLEIVRAITGEYGEQAPFQTFLRQEREGIRNDLAKLRSCRFVAAMESDEGKRLAEALIKSLTGGDPITARFLHAEFFTYMPQFKVWLATNHRPEIRDSSHAMWRRVRLIPFDVVIPDAEQDKTLPAQLKAELPGILAWAVRGCLTWQQEGLNPPPEAVVVATQEYKEEQDLISAFITESCLIRPGLTTPSSDLYLEYVKWCEKNGERAVNQTIFGNKLTEKGYRKDRSSVTGKVIRYGLGLKIIPES